MRAFCWELGEPVSLGYPDIPGFPDYLDVPENPVYLDVPENPGFPDNPVSPGYLGFLGSQDNQLFNYFSLKIIAKMFGSFRKILYLCIVNQA